MLASPGALCDWPLKRGRMLGGASMPRRQHVPICDCFRSRGAIMGAREGGWFNGKAALVYEVSTYGGLYNRSVRKSSARVFLCVKVCVL